MKQAIALAGGGTKAVSGRRVEGNAGAGHPV